MKRKTFFIELYLNTLFFLYGLIIVLCDNFKYLNFIYLINVVLGISFIFFALIGNVKIYINSFFKIYLLFIILAIGSSYWSSDYFYSARRSLNLVLIFLNIFFIYNINKKYSNYNFLNYGIFTALFINFLWLIGIIDIGLTYEGWRFQGSVLQANNFVFILMFGLMMTIYSFIQDAEKVGLNFLLFPLFFMIILMIFFTASKAGLISALFLIALLVMLMVRVKNLVYIILGVIFIYIIVVFTPLVDFITENSTLDLEYTFANLEDRIGGFFSAMESSSSGSSGSTNLRVQMINNAIDMWALRPIFGNGMAAYEIFYGGYSHNNIVELLSSFGFIGFVLYYSLYVYIFMEIRKISALKTKVLLVSFLILFLLFDQSIVSYTGKFKILSLLIILLLAQQNQKINVII